MTSNQPVGTVLSQDPAAGTKILETRKVVLTVSGTQTSVSVPSVVGQSPASAGGILTQAGLNVGSQTTACSGQPNGVVSAQNPAAGATVPPNTPVNLVVSSGSCVSVPGVVGQSQGAATSAITGAGLVANTTFDTGCPNGAQPGNVDSQSPAPNAQVNSGTTVNISVCQSATTTTTTTHHHDAVVAPRRRRPPAPPTTVQPPGPRPPSRRQVRVSVRPAVAAPSWPRKLASRAGPDTVRTDSGWNCTPSTRQGAVAQAHDHAVGRGGRHLELVGHRVGAHHERVVARGHEGVGEPGEEALAVVVDLRGLAVHQVRGRHDVAAEGLADALVAEADAQQRDLPGQRRGWPPG